MVDSNLIKKKFSIFSKDEKEVFIDVYFKDENIWLSQKLMSELFDCSTDNISLHLKNIFNSKELVKDSVTEKISTTASDGKSYNTTFYSLDVIISVGYRVNSKQATSFRIWATNHLKEFMLKGYVLDDERLKQGRDFNKDYFKELLERIRSIRASERRVYQQITDIFSECSIDYDRDSSVTRDFFSTVQNKFHYAITNKTAAEIIYDEVSHKKENVGLKTWKKSPNNRILKSDVKVAKNYLDEKQIRELESSISSFFDYIERLIGREKTFTMKEFSNSVNKFLEFNEYGILGDNGKISKQEADEKASIEYDIFNKTQVIESDFDKQIKKYLKNGGTE